MSEMLADKDARTQSVGSDASVLVQAPAGSGKTTLLTQRYLRLLARVEAPERILALTFTRLAAQEMRGRVLAALRAAGDPEAPQQMNRDTWKLAVAARRQLVKRNIDVESQPSRLRIETIDAFNAWLAGQLPIAAGVGAGLRVLSESRPSYEEAARRCLAHDAEDVFGAAVERVLELDDQRWRKLVKLIADLLPSRDRWLPLLAGRLEATAALDPAQLIEVRRHFDEDLELLVARALRRAEELLGAEKLGSLAPLLAGAAHHLAAQQPEMHEWVRDATPLRADAHDLTRWRCLARLLLTERGTLRKRLTVAEGFPPGSPHKAPLLQLIDEFDRDPRVRDSLVEVRTLPAPAYSDAQWERVREVAQVLVLAAAQLDTVFREQGAVDFPAVSMAALRALGSDEAPTDLSLRLDYRLQHILLDEFQDTSGAQLDLVRLLTAGWQAGDGRSVFSVGDPMQSIYGFRQAEVRAFLELADDGIGQVRFDLQRLRSNFRSSRPLVDWINVCFAKIMPQTDDRGRGAIAFRPSTALHADPAASEPAVLVQGFASRTAESAAIADMIADALREQPQWRIAVLVRAKSHAREVASSLRSQGIAFRAVDIEPLQERLVVRDIIALTNALLHLGDRTAWFALLRAPWCGLTLADLLIVSAAPGPIWHTLRNEAKLTALSEDGRGRVHRVRGTLDAAFAVRTHGAMARWIESTWLCLGGASVAGSAQELMLAQRAFERLRVLEERGLPDPSELAAAFGDLFADESAPTSEAGAATAVEIMTIHKSKGLEFDMVVLPALERTVPNNQDQLLLSHQFARAGRDGMVMAARPPVGAEGDRLFEFLRCQVRDAGQLEAQRLLYVACTRAKWRLRLTALVDTDDSSDAESPATVKSWRPRSGSLLWVLWPVVSGEFVVPASAQAGAGAPRAQEDAPHGGPLLRVPSGWVAPLLSASPVADVLVAPAAAPAELPVFDWAGETARRIGSLVHGELQTMRLSDSDEVALRSRLPYYRRWLAVHSVPKERLADAADRVVEALIAVQSDPKGRWIMAAGYADDFREYALSGSTNGVITRAVLDRSFIDQGVRWVIDYKTSAHGGGGREEFLDREVERYTPQLQRYASLARRLGPQDVRAGLYFPLLRAWREIVLD